MTDVPHTDVSRPSALPTANLLHRGIVAQSVVDQNSAEYLDGIEEEWNKKVDMEIEMLVDGMVDLVSLASVRLFLLPLLLLLYILDYNRHFNVRSVTRINLLLPKSLFKFSRVQNQW